MANQQSNDDFPEQNRDLTKILMEIKAFDQMQTTDRLRQWLENPERRPKNDLKFPVKQKKP